MDSHDEANITIDIIPIFKPLYWKYNVQYKIVLLIFQID